MYVGFITYAVIKYIQQQYKVWDNLNYTVNNLFYCT